MGNRLSGKVALISGGARGLGASHVELFAEHGAQVVFGDILDAQGQELEQQLRDRGLPVSYVHLDVTNVADWRTAVEATLAEFGSLTTLVNNAGIYTWHGLEEADDIEWSRII